MTKHTKQEPEILELTRESAEHVEADEIVMRQAGARSIEADAVSVRQGGLVRVRAKQMDMLQGGVVLAQSEEARLTASEAGLLYSEGPVAMDQSGAGLLLGRDTITMDQSGAVVMAAPEIHADETNAVFLLARRVDGPVHAVFGPRESLMLGLAAGAAAGLVYQLTRWLRSR